MSEQKSQEATDPRIGEILHDMLCAVSIKRCDEYGCAHGVASSMPKEWRCHACAAYDALTALQQRVERLEAVQEAARAVWMEERLVLQAALAHAEQRVEQVTAEHSTLQDAAFHFQTCAVCRRQGEDACESGRQFASFLRGELDGD